MKVDYIVVDRETGEIKEFGYMDRQAFESTVVDKGRELVEIKTEDRDKLSGENIDWEGDRKFMWRYCKEKKCLELKDDCEICPETGIPRKKAKE